jgi:hypothetical protein
LLIQGRVHPLYPSCAREGRGESGASLDEVHMADIARTPLLAANAEKCSRSDQEEAGKGDGSGTS